MIKRAFVLGLAALALLLAQSAGAMAEEMNVDPGSNSFTGVGGAATFVASGEPTITCDKVSLSGSFSGFTTASATLHLTGCHASALGITVSCNTSGSEAKTIKIGATLHLSILRTIVTRKPAVRVTPSFAVITCAGVSSLQFAGNVIGTITSPACGGESKTMTLAFEATGSTQNHLEYTGVKYDLTASTSGGSAVTAGFNATVTMESSVAMRMTC